MSYKTRLDRNFFINLLLLSNHFIHNPGKADSTKIINQRLKNISQILKINQDDIKYYYQYLMRNNIFIIQEGYLFINLDLLRKNCKVLPEQDKTACLILQNNYEVLVKPEITLSSLFFLIQFAELVQKDVVYKFVISENSLHNAYLHKVTDKMIRKFLSAAADRPKLPDNIEYTIQEVFRRTGEVQLEHGEGYLSASNYIIKNLYNDEKLKSSLRKKINPFVSLLHDNVKLMDIFLYLKNRKYFPVIHYNKTFVKNPEEISITFNIRELEKLLLAFHALKNIGFKHKISINLGTLNRIITEIEDVMDDPSLITKAIEGSMLYEQELNESVKSYVLKSLKACHILPRTLVLNKLAEQYPDANPATTRKEIIKMIQYAMKYKLKLLIAVSSLDHKNQEFIIEPRYLHADTSLHYTDKKNKGKNVIAVKKIVFSTLI